MSVRKAQEALQVMSLKTKEKITNQKEKFGNEHWLTSSVN